MMMTDINEAKKAVIEAGKLLVKEGLIQRTWGNVSCRLDRNTFVITPSGMDYMSLTPDKIVMVSMDDLAFAGDVKPSSEKGIHAACYRLRPDVNFVIHTHQTYASLIGMSGRDINNIEGKAKEIIGDNVPLAAYGLPGSKSLKNAVAVALKRSSSKAVLMHHHGALCLGTNSDDAFQVANTLEDVCKEKLLSRFADISGNVAESFESVSDWVAGNLMKASNPVELTPYTSVRKFAVAELTPVKGGKTVTVSLDTGLPVDPSADLPDTAVLHARIYNARQDVNAIVHSKDESTVAVSKLERTIRPFLDDFAQIAGMTVKNADYNPANAEKTAKKAVKKLKGRDAVLLSHNGAVCVGADSDEAEAVKLVTDKGCQSLIAAELYSNSKKYIGAADSLLMRVVYKTKYSKKK